VAPCGLGKWPNFTRVGEVLLGPFAVNRVVADKGAQLVEAGYAG
jgi:hypothetical protein